MLQVIIGCSKKKHSCFIFFNLLKWNVIVENGKLKLLY